MEGSNGLDIKNVVIFKNNIKITEDNHPAFTKTNSRNNIYSFEIDNYETGAAYIIKANIRGNFGNDSKGVVFLKRK